MKTSEGEGLQVVRSSIYTILQLILTLKYLLLYARNYHVLSDKTVFKRFTDTKLVGQGKFLTWPVFVFCE